MRKTKEKKATQTTDEIIIPDIEKITVGYLKLQDFRDDPEYCFREFQLRDQIDRWLVTKDERILNEWSFKFNSPFRDVAEALEDVIRNEKRT